MTIQLSAFQVQLFSFLVTWVKPCGQANLSITVGMLAEISSFPGKPVHVPAHG